MAKRIRPPSDPDIAVLPWGGDWTQNPAWPRIAKATTTLGIDPERARTELYALLPPSVCRRMAADQAGARLLAPLFTDGIVPGTYEFPLLGHDLADCPGWREAKNLVGGLRNPGEHWNARLEAAVWASVVRAGLSVTYETPGITSDKSADLLIDEKGKMVALEAKTLQRSKADTNRDFINEVIRDLAMAVEGDGLQLTFEIGVELALRCPTTDPVTFEAELEAIRSTAVAWVKSTHLELGRHEVPALGAVVVIATGVSGLSWSSNLDEGGPDVAARRIARAVREASTQVAAHPGAAVRAALVRVPPWDDATGQRLEAAILAHRDHAPFRALDVIVLVNVAPWRPTCVMVCLMPWAPAGVASMRWLTALRELRMFGLQDAVSSSTK